MTNEIDISGSHKDFEDIKHIDENGVEFWTARELFVLLGYSRWESFEDVIKKAINSATNSDQVSENHFRHLTKKVKLGSNATRSIKDWKLDRYACYLIAQNGDSGINQIALAQTYFAIQTRKQEIFETSADAEKRLFIRLEEKLLVKIKNFLAQQRMRVFLISDYLMMLDTEVCMVCLFQM